MYWKEDKEQMVYAYELLYEIEMALVNSIIERYRENYGYKWYKRLNANVDFERANYRKLITYLLDYRSFPEVDSLAYEQIYSLYPIRNKICRIKPLTKKEFQCLKECHELVIKLFPNEKVTKKF